MPARRRAPRARLFRRTRRASVGAGLAATAPIRRGAVVHSWAASRILPRPTFRSVQIGPRRHAHDPLCLNLLNHSCDPNVRIDVARRAVLALRPIRAGELLAFFYPSTEWEMARPFRCRCGSDRCIGWVRGAKHVDPRRLAGRRLSPHIRALLRAARRAPDGRGPVGRRGPAC